MDENREYDRHEQPVRQVRIVNPLRPEQDAHGGDRDSQHGQVEAGQQAE
jgi:hypothetical protein